MLNQVQIIGHLGNDPETKYTQGGAAVCNFSVATTERWTKDGEQQERTEWHRVVAFGKLGEICGEYLKKGAQVFVQGKLQTESYEKDGVTRYTTKIIAGEMKMLGKRESGGGERPQRQASAPRQAPASRPEPRDDFADDDIPF